MFLMLYVNHASMTAFVKSCQLEPIRGLGVFSNFSLCMGDYTFFVNNLLKFISETAFILL